MSEVTQYGKGFEIRRLRFEGVSHEFRTQLDEFRFQF